MYGDHHVIEVRRLLLELPGVQDVYASSAFQVVEVTYDPAQLDAGAITARLDEAGYLGDLLVPVESGAPATEKNGKQHYFRHSAAMEATGRSVTFAQNVAYEGRPLWPCPGLGALPLADEGD